MVTRVRVTLLSLVALGLSALAIFFVLTGPSSLSLRQSTPTPTAVPLTAWLTSAAPQPNDHVQLRGRAVNLLDERSSAQQWRVDLRAEGFDAGQRTAALVHLYVIQTPNQQPDIAVGECMQVDGLVQGQQPTGETMVFVQSYKQLDSSSCT
jgi:hypothetical protein